MNTKKVIVLGAGPAGLSCATALAKMGIETVLIEKEQKPGGQLKNWHTLFPHQQPADEILSELKNALPEEVSTLYSVDIESIERVNGMFSLLLTNKVSYNANALVIATGFSPFDAFKKEEYGYGIYRNVSTSVELEQHFDMDEWFVNNAGKKPSSFALVHCVGSRDEKAGNNYCSRLCCVTAVKQAIGLRKKFPTAAIYCLYMDLRMFGRHYEELYREAQELHQIRFIRGRLSEAYENQDGTVLLKVEDTLASSRLKFSVDKLILMVGMVPSPATLTLGNMLQIHHADDNFLNTLPIPGTTKTDQAGVFLAGTCSGPASLPEVIVSGKACAHEVFEFLKQLTTR